MRDNPIASVWTDAVSGTEDDAVEAAHLMGLPVDEVLAARQRHLERAQRKAQEERRAA